MNESHEHNLSPDDFQLHSAGEELEVRLPLSYPASTREVLERSGLLESVRSFCEQWQKHPHTHSVALSVVHDARQFYIVAMTGADSERAKELTGFFHDLCVKVFHPYTSSTDVRSVHEYKDDWNTTPAFINNNAFSFGDIPPIDMTSGSGTNEAEAATQKF